MRYLSRKLFGIIITSLITLSPLSIAFADESTLPIGESEQKVGSKSNPSIATPAPKENSLGGGKPISPFGGADNYPIGAPMSEAVGGGPASGLASSNGILGSGLPNEVESAWPSPGSILHFPNREVRVSFKNKVDTSKKSEEFKKNQERYKKINSVDEFLEGVKYLDETNQYGYDFTQFDKKKIELEKMPLDKLKRLYELAKKGHTSVAASTTKSGRTQKEDEEFLELIHIIFP